MNAMDQVVKLYTFKNHTIQEMEFKEYNNPIHTVLADSEFQSVRDEIEMMGIHVKIVVKDEHVPEVERQSRLFKERARAIIQTMPYQKIPKKMKIALLQYVVFWLNNILKDDQDYSPKELIMGGQKLDYKSLCKLPFGSYAQVPDDNPQMNTMESRTTGAINLGPTGNILGGHRYLSLKTGEFITRRTWTELPVPSDVIIRVEELSSGSDEIINKAVTNDDDTQDMG
jgi:hypothetical protein